MPIARKMTPATTKLDKIALRRPTLVITTQEIRVHTMLSPTPIWLIVNDMSGLMPAMMKK